jgi:hypothetical protein
MIVRLAALLALVAALVGVGARSAWAADEAAAAGSQPLALRSREPVRRFALVIGNNSTLDPSQAPLRFADDDAARMAEVLLEVGVDVELLAAFDRDTQAVFPEIVAGSRAPTPSAVEAAWERLVRRMQEAADGGARVELLFFYSGHGDVGSDGQGYLTLQAGKLTRTDLFRKILEMSPADANHLVIDACRSEQFVLSRGGDRPWKPDRADADATGEVQRYLDRSHLGAFPNTCVVLAHSADQQTHEWEHYRGGIFSHQVISGLRGAADLNGDGRIEYSELGAFVAAANSAVKDPRAKLEVVVRPPADDERRPILVHQDVARRRVLLFSGSDPSLYTLEDARGIRIADIRRADPAPGYVRLPPGDVFVQREPRAQGARPDEVRIPADAGGVILASRLSFRPAERATRGALDQAFRAGLFATAFGSGYYSGYVDQRGLLPVEDPAWRADLWDVETTDARAVDEVIVADPVERDPPLEPAVDARLESHWWDRGAHWGGISFGTSITPFRARSVHGHTRRFTADDVPSCLAPALSGGSGCSNVAGFDLRWQFFHVAERSKYPRLLGYFRTGYGGGNTTFGPLEDPSYAPGQATEFSYVAVPLFVGGNIYVFDRFPVRPYAGLGFGFDVLRVRYRRSEHPGLRDTSARIGFELHAGIEGRINNWVALSVEVMQQWSARRKLDGVPDFANETLTLVTSVAIGIPLARSRAEPRRTRRVIRASRRPSAPSPLPKVTAPVTSQPPTAEVPQDDPTPDATPPGE